jgi:hypothetical protein
LALIQDAAPFQAAQPFPGVPAVVAGQRAKAPEDERPNDDTEHSDAVAAQDGCPVMAKRRFAYAELEQYIRCPRKYKYMSVLGLWDSSENAMLRFHRYLRHGERILRQRAATAPVPDWNALEGELRAEWEAIGPVGHAYEAFYHRNALTMLQREWSELMAYGGAPMEAGVAAPLEAELRGCVVEVAADRMVYGADVRDETACRPITLVRQRTGSPAKSHEDDLRLPLFAIACRQRDPDAQARIELRYRGDVLRESDDEPAAATAYTVDMTAKAIQQAEAYLRPARKQRSVLDKLDDAAAGIVAGRFPPLPDERMCARCSFHSICPADLALTD